MAFRSIFLFSRRQVSPVSDIGEEWKGERVYCLPISQTTYNGISLWFQKMSPISASPPSEVPAVWPDCARPPRSSVRPHRCGPPDTRYYLQCCVLTSTRTEQPSSYNIRQRVKSWRVDTTEMTSSLQSSKKHLMSLIRLVDNTVIYKIFTLEDTVKLDGYQLIPFL